ncbi:hypothetical protein HYS47_02195 [Candidatus Woesearchaeota archaeon]|nr:hypothetical protein [Candidatus Woesearchaeota archaeon]
MAPLPGLSMLEKALSLFAPSSVHNPSRRLFLAGIGSAAVLAALAPLEAIAQGHDDNPSNHSFPFPAEDDFREQYEAVQAFLNAPYNGFGINVSKGFKVIALSNMAEGLVKYVIDHPEKREEAHGLLDKVVAIALKSDVSPYQKPIERQADFSDFGNDNLYESHLNIILGVREAFVQDGKYKGLNARLSNDLARKLTSHPRGIRSYSRMRAVWPADQVATLYSLHLFDRNARNTNGSADQNNGSGLAAEPTRQWLQYMKQHGTDPITGLHKSELVSTQSGRHPRGCALSWSVYYMASFAPEEARQLWDAYKQHYLVTVGPYSGFREWPVGIEGKQDADSGPILFGIGVAASALGIRAAVAMHDHNVYMTLRNSQAIINASIVTFGDDKVKKLSKNILTQALELNFNDGAGSI